MNERQPPPVERTSDVFGLTGHEALYYRFTHARLRELLLHEQTTVHQITLDRNNYGEFLFVTFSRQHNGHRYGLTAFGLGYHAYREIWLHQEWIWYALHPISSTFRHTLSKEAVWQSIEERQAEITDQVSAEAPSASARLFTLLADLTDEDGAFSELDDLYRLGYDLDEE